MKKKLLTLIACCALLASCSSNKSNQSEKEETLKVSTEKVELTDSAFFAQTRILPLETTDASLIQSINAICMAGDTLFLLDNRKSSFSTETESLSMPFMTSATVRKNMLP